MADPSYTSRENDVMQGFGTFFVTIAEARWSHQAEVRKFTLHRGNVSTQR